ncbi:MAG TPA: hypothetical protein VGG71_02850, partial [Chitinophagaceae bacterium]
MKTIKSVLMPCCVMFSVFYFSCSKDSNSTGNNSDNETQTSVDNSFAQNTNDDVTSISTQSEDNGVAGTLHDSTYSHLLSPCATVTINTTVTPKQLTIDFGSTNCLCYDGKYRRGKILVSFTGLYREAGSSHTITFDNYYVNDYKVEGTQTVVNNGPNAAGNLSFNININSTITDTTGKQLTYTSTRTREWVGGENTTGLDGWQDDVYSITGTASGTSFNGTAYTANITSPLIVAL